MKMVAFLALAAIASAATDNFDDAKPDPLPAHWDGKWTGTQTGDGVAKWSAPAVWHSLRVEFKGSQFTVTFDGKKVIEASDDSFADAGKVGVWTKADSVTLFDDFSYGGK
jgi:hypothetical protein